MRILILGASQRQALQNLRKQAIEYPTDAATLLTIRQHADWRARIVELMRPHTTTIPNGYTVKFTIEKQPVGMCRHLSVSVDARDKLPSTHAVQLLMDELGFTPRPLTDDSFGRFLYAEDLDDGKAINVLELVDAHEQPERLQ